MSSADQTQQVTHRAAVLGSPVAHSLSPALHRAGYAAAGLTGWEYQRIECDGAALPGLVAGSGPEWAGFSVTMPGKSAAAAMADQRRKPRIPRVHAPTLSRPVGSSGRLSPTNTGQTGSGRSVFDPASRPSRIACTGAGTPVISSN